MTSGVAGRAENLRPSLSVMLSVWRALFMREAAQRLWSGRASWLWLLLEPAAHVAFLMIIFSTLRDRSMPGVDFAMFLAVGVLGFQMFKNSAQKPIGAIDANRALFTYRQVRPVDTVLVRCLLEGVLYIFVTGVLVTAAYFFGMDMIPYDPLRAMTAFFLLWVLGVGVGLILSTAAGLVPELGRVSSLMFGPLYFLSGIFFRPDRLPPAVREWVMLNPVIHGIESLRGSIFPGYHAMPDISLSYLGMCGLCMVFLGLALQLRFDRRLVAR